MSDWEDVAMGPSAAVDSSGGWEDVAMGAPAQNSEVRGIANRGLQGLSSFLGLVDQFNPIRGNTNPDPNSSKLTLGAPPLFGLFSNPNEAPIGQVFDQVTKDYGVQTKDKPQTFPGKIAGNALENAFAAVGFGPAAMVGNAVFGGGGASVGEAAFGEKGRAVGSLVGGLSPMGISKLGIVKEIGEQLGPTVSQLPVLRELFGDSAVQAAVGRALNKSADDPIALEKALGEASSIVGPPSKLDSLKTTAEITGDTGIMRAEDAVQNMLPNAPFKNMAVERAATRADEVLQNYDPKITPYETSKALESSVTKAVEKVEEIESAAWSALPKDAPIDTKLGTLQDDLTSAIDNITFSGDVPVTGTAAALLKRANNLGTEGVTSFESLQKLRSQALTLSRATAKGTDDAERTANQVSNAIANHLDNVIDANVNAGKFTQAEADLWRASRQLTKDKISTFAAARAGTENAGTKGLEQLALKGTALDNTTLLREGLNSPDKLAAHIKAAAMGGEDVKPLYQQALKSELDGTPQSQWRNIIDRKRDQWELVFTKDELANLEKNLTDIEAELVKNRGAITTNSATNTRGNVQGILNSEKGIAALSTGVKNAGTLLAAGAGAQHGWNKSETTAGGIANALLYGSAGALFGKASKNALTRTSDKFDSILTNALKNPSAAAEAIQAAKPSELGKALQGAVMGAAKGTGSQAAGTALNSLIGRVIQNSPQLPTKNSQQEGQSQSNSSLNNTASQNPKLDTALRNVLGEEMYKKQPVNQVIEAVKSNPVDHAIALMESNLNPKAKNPESSASGLFQLIKKTAGTLGVKDVFDAGENYDGYLKLKQAAIDKFDLDPNDYRSIYASHYLGETAFRKLLNGETLSDKQQAQVEYLQNKLFPKLDKFYAKAVKETGGVMA